MPSDTINTLIFYTLLYRFFLTKILRLFISQYSSVEKLLKKRGEDTPIYGHLPLCETQEML